MQFERSLADFAAFLALNTILYVGDGKEGYSNGIKKQTACVVDCNTCQKLNGED